MPTGRQMLRTMSPKRARHPTPEDDDKSGLERKSSLSRRSNSLRGLRFPRKTHEAPSPSEEESFKREWGMTMTQEVRFRTIPVLDLPSWVLAIRVSQYVGTLRSELALTAS